LTWPQKKKVVAKPKERSDFFKASNTIQHDQGLKILVWGDSEVGKGRLVT